MLQRTRCSLVIALVAAVTTIASMAVADTIGAPGFGSSTSMFGYAPKVPVSAFANPAAWFDPSRLHLSTSITVGSGGGVGSQALQTTSLSYQFKAPVWLNVSVGNAWGASSRLGNSSSVFLQGVDFGMRPFSSMEIQVHYRDVRSPLQYSPYDRGFGSGY
jgi:hypothetical protein